jgi:hypothetical protein
MTTAWTAVDRLIRDLGAIRRVAPQVSVDDHTRAALDEAITAAAEAIDFTIDAPANPDRLLVARDALGLCAEIVLALDSHARGLPTFHRETTLRARALKLIEAARALPPSHTV